MSTNKLIMIQQVTERSLQQTLIVVGMVQENLEITKTLFVEKFFEDSQASYDSKMSDRAISLM